MKTHRSCSMLLTITALAAAAAGPGCDCGARLRKASGLVATPPALAFGDVMIGVGAVRMLQVTNEGSGKVVVESATVSGDADFAVQGFAPVTLAVGSGFQLQVSFQPSSVGPHAGVLSLAADTAPGNPARVDLSGNGVLAGSDGGAGADGGPPASPAGCADGTREGFLDATRYPLIAGCSGAWSVPGLGLTSAGIAPACNRQGGNSSPHAGGNGCSALDLCAAGWHVCQGMQEVQQKAGSCADAVPFDAPAPGLFFAVAQHSCTNSVCDNASDPCAISGVPAGTADNDNDVFGCSGPDGTNAHLGGGLSSGNGCAPLNSTFACMQSNSLCWNQAMPNIGPWQASGSNSYDESDWVTKNGCQNDSCSYSGSPVGPSDEGGVLCCAD